MQLTWSLFVHTKISMANTNPIFFLVFQDVFQISHLSFAQWVTVMKFSLPVILLDELLNSNR